MKQIVCEMCGSTDIMKQDGIFVCQSCGMKYSLEEARKMMIEGTVDVQGTVKVDNSAFVEKYLANARRAKEKEDWEETEKYYNMVEQNAPDNIEAIFYSSYGKAKSSLVDSDIYKRQAAFKVLTNCVSLIDDKYSVEKAEEEKLAIEEISKDIQRMMVGNFVFTEWKNGYGVVTRTNKDETYILFIQLKMTFVESVENIIAKDDQAYLHQVLIDISTLCSALDYFNRDYRNKCKEFVKDEQAKLEAIKQKRIDAYWSEHADKKKALDDETESLKKQIADLSTKINNLPEHQELLSLQPKLEMLTKERDSLGMFKGKEKKALQEQIDAVNAKIKEATANKEIAVKPINNAIAPLQARIEEIAAELAAEG